MKPALLALVCLLAAGCTTSRVPLEPARNDAFSTEDVRLVGRWVAENDTGKMTAVVARHGDELRLDMSQLSDVPGEAASAPELYRLRIARIGESSYASILRIGHKPRDWALFEYRFSGVDQVTVRLVDDDFMLDAVRSKQIRGKIDKRAPRAVTLTASRAELRAFVLAHGGQIFAGQQTEWRRDCSGATSERAP